MVRRTWNALLMEPQERSTVNCSPLGDNANTENIMWLKNLETREAPRFHVFLATYENAFSFLVMCTVFQRINLLCLGVVSYSVTQEGRSERVTLACLVVMLSQHPSHPHNLLRLCVQGDPVVTFKKSYERHYRGFCSIVDGTNLTTSSRCRNITSVGL